MLSDDDKLFSFYNDQLIALSARAEQPRRLSSPTATAHAVSPVCGSEIDVDLLIKDDRVAAFGFEVEACALTKTVIAVMQDAIIGKTQEEIAAAGRELSALLEGSGKAPSGDWQALGILAPVKDYKARHNAILLPFEAVEKAFKNSRK